MTNTAKSSLTFLLYLFIDSGRMRLNSNIKKRKATMRKAERTVRDVPEVMTYNLICSSQVCCCDSKSTSRVTIFGSARNASTFALYCVAKLPRTQKPSIKLMNAHNVVKMYRTRILFCSLRVAERRAYTRRSFLSLPSRKASSNMDATGKKPSDVLNVSAAIWKEAIERKCTFSARMYI